MSTALLRLKQEVVRGTPVFLLSRRIRSAPAGWVGCSERHQHKTPFTELVFRFHGQD